MKYAKISTGIASIIKETHAKNGAEEATLLHLINMQSATVPRKEHPSGDTAVILNALSAIAQRLERVELQGMMMSTPPPDYQRTWDIIQALMEKSPTTLVISARFVEIPG